MIPLKYQERLGWKHTGFSAVLQMSVFSLAPSQKVSLPMAGVRLVKVPLNPDQSVIANQGVI